MGLVLLTSCTTEYQFVGYNVSLDKCIQQKDYMSLQQIEQHLNDSCNHVLNSTDHEKQLIEWANDESFQQLFWDGHVTLNLTQKEYRTLFIHLINNYYETEN